jgi:superfamily II DNA or RNA helicase
MLNTGELDAVFATYQLAAEGLDCPNLRYVVFATPEKDERIVEQASGRVARRSDGKEKGIVIDFVDKFGMLIGWSKRREKIYEKKLGFTIV